MKIILILSLTFSSSLFAKRSKSKKRRPPIEAIKACESLEEGATCSFIGRRGYTVNGSCVIKDSSKPAACKPER